MKKKLIHIALISVECLLLSSVTAWGLWGNRPLADGVYLTTPSTLTICLQDGQESLLSEIDYLRVYYTSKKDSEWSDRQTYLLRDFRRGASIVCGKLPAGAFGFRIDFHYKKNVRMDLPKIAEVRLAGKLIHRNKLKEFYFENHGFGGYRYVPDVVLNGYLPHFILFTVISWVALVGFFANVLEKTNK